MGLWRTPFATGSRSILVCDQSAIIASYRVAEWRCSNRRLQNQKTKAINHYQSSRSIASGPVKHTSRRSQIPIAPAATPYVPTIAVSFLGGFRTPAAGVRPTAVRSRHPKPFTITTFRTSEKQRAFRRSPSCRACTIYSVPCKSHDHATGCEVSWDYRGFVQASYKVKARCRWRRKLGAADSGERAGRGRG